MQEITADKPSVSSNGTAQTQTQLAPNLIGKILGDNTPLVIWLVFFAIGGGILALYYAQIGYLPDIEWKAALIYLFVGSMVGGAVGLLLTISLFFPGVIWAEFIIFDVGLSKCLAYDSQHQEPSGKESIHKEPCIRSMIIYLGAPFVAALLLSHLALWFRAPINSADGVWYLDLYWFIVVLILIVTFFVMRTLFGCILSHEGWKKFWSILKTKPLDVIRNKQPVLAENQNREVFKYAFWFTLAVLLNQIAMYVTYRLADRPRGGFTFFVLTALCTAAVAISTHTVAFLYQEHKRKAIIAALVAAGLLLFTADNFSSLSVRLMNHYGIGYYERFNLLVTKDCDDNLRTLGVPACGLQQLCNVEILSKIGDHYYLRIGDQAYVTLRKSDVVAIRPLHHP
ncbi:MAG TPA: hypothetical protein VFH96_11125 [Pyrinomonadaceae bacterium]|nr:hypothetical protein [Pyrinomonadaceae bacterium]